MIHPGRTFPRRGQKYTREAPGSCEHLMKLPSYTLSVRIHKARPVSPSEAIRPTVRRGVPRPAHPLRRVVVSPFQGYVLEMPAELAWNRARRTREVSRPASLPQALGGRHKEA